MFSEAPELYDLFYGQFKDYKAEAAKVAALLRERAPEARHVLDAGCGTAEHAVYLSADHGYRIDGLDIEPGFVAIAQEKVPEGRFWEGDMADFSLGESFDAIVCLFSAIGHVRTLERMEGALRCFSAHLKPGGVVLLEPWYEPHDWHPGRVYLRTVEQDGLKAVRMSHSGLRGSVSTLEFHYLIGQEEGVEHRVESHELGLFTRAQIEDGFTRAGFGSVDYDAEGLEGRGLYVATLGD